ncbi:MAG: hypothetical protein GY730_07985 [bacterium]|nr:hypothetical protein [bacterium]
MTLRKSITQACDQYLLLPVSTSFLSRHGKPGKSRAKALKEVLDVATYFTLKTKIKKYKNIDEQLIVQYLAKRVSTNILMTIFGVKVYKAVYAPTYIKKYYNILNGGNNNNKSLRPMVRSAYNRYLSNKSTNLRLGIKSSIIKHKHSPFIPIALNYSDKIIHFIWIGKDHNPDVYSKIASKINYFRHLLETSNKRIRFLLWVNNDLYKKNNRFSSIKHNHYSRNISNLNDLKNLYGVEIMSIEKDLFGEVNHFEYPFITGVKNGFLINTIGLVKYAFAADIIKYAVLFFYGGLYCDVSLRASSEAFKINNDNTQKEMIWNELVRSKFRFTGFSSDSMCPYSSNLFDFIYNLNWVMDSYFRRENMNPLCLDRKFIKQAMKPISISHTYDIQIIFSNAKLYIFGDILQGISEFYSGQYIGKYGSRLKSIYKRNPRLSYGTVVIGVCQASCRLFLKRFLSFTAKSPHEFRRVIEAHSHP